MKRILLLPLFFFASLTLLGQISGVIVSRTGEPLIGVVVQSADGSVSTTTDYDGYFELDVPEGTELEVASLGYRSVTVAATKGMRVELREKGFKPQPAGKSQDQPWSVFILANGMSGFPFSPAVGFTVGMVRKAGWYVNFMTGFGFHMDDAVSNYGKMSYEGIEWRPFYTGESSKQTLSLTLGGVVRLGKAPVYMYLGAGWAYKSVTLETNNGTWIAYVTAPANNMSPLHSLALEAGIMVNIKGFALSIGYEPLIGFGGPYSSKNAAHELKIGLGGMFNCKRRTQQ